MWLWGDKGVGLRGLVEALVVAFDVALCGLPVGRFVDEADPVALGEDWACVFCFLVDGFCHLLTEPFGGSVNV